MGIPVGRWLDRNGPRAVMTAGSLVAVASVVAIAAAPTLPWFFAAWLMITMALAPFVGAWLASLLGGYATAFVVLGVVAVAAAALSLTTVRL